MSTASVQWAYGALTQLGMAASRGGVARPTTVLGSAPSASTASAVPNFLVSTDTSAPRARVLLLARRGSGALTGLELGDQRSPFSAPLHRRSDGRLSKQTQLALYLAHRRLPVVDANKARNDGFLTAEPLLVHRNPLIAWRLGPRAPVAGAAPIYAHTLKELARLTARDIKTIETSQSALVTRCYEWDNWRQLVQEPGWSLRYGDDGVVSAAISGELSVDELPAHTTEIELIES